MTTEALFVGLDLGGTNLRVRLENAQGEHLGTARRRHQRGAPGEVLSLLEALLEELSPQAAKHPLYVGAAVAAMLSADGQSIINAPNLSKAWNNTNFVAQLHEHFAQVQKVILVNDLGAITYGETTAGAAQGFADVLCVYVGSGVGSGFVQGQTLQEGANRVAGELGHVKVVLEGGRACGCGARGCLEAYTGGHHLPEILQEAASAGGYLAQRLQTNKSLQAEDLEAGAAQNDATCLAILDQSARYLGLAIANAAILLDPGCLVLGGGVLEHSPLLREKMLAHLRLYLTTPTLSTLSIRDAQLGDEAGLIGAIRLIRDTTT